VPVPQVQVPPWQSLVERKDALQARAPGGTACAEARCRVRAGQGKRRRAQPWGRHKDKPQARLNDAPRDLRPCHTAQLVLGQAEPVARKVRDVGRLAQVHRQVRQVVQPVAAKDGQVCQAQAGPERDAAGQRVPVDHRLRRPVRARSARPLAR